MQVKKITSANYVENHFLKIALNHILIIREGYKCDTCGKTFFMKMIWKNTFSQFTKTTKTYIFSWRRFEETHSLYSWRPQDHKCNFCEKLLSFPKFEETHSYNLWSRQRCDSCRKTFFMKTVWKITFIQFMKPTKITNVFDMKINFFKRQCFSQLKYRKNSQYLSKYEFILHF